MPTIRKSPDGRFHVLTLSAAEVEKEAADEKEFTAAAAARLDAKLRDRNEKGREMIAQAAKEISNSNKTQIFEIERAEREAKAKIASIEAWNAYAERLDASGKALDAWEANRGKRRKVRISQWLVGEEA